MLHETRIVLIEKIEQENSLEFLRIIDEDIKLRMSVYHGVVMFIPKKWLNNKLVKKVLEDNGFEIFDKYDEDKKINQSYIRREGYISDLFK